MLEKFTSENAADFRQRYEHTFGWLHTSKKHFVYVSAVGREQTYFEDEHGTKMNLNLNSPYNFEFIPVTNGYYYSTDNHIYYLQRVPARQWRRGICSANTSMTTIDGTQIEIDIKNLGSIFKVENQPYHFEVDIPCALNKHFAITDDHQLKFRNRVIGSREGHTVIVDNIFYQELVDVNKRTGYKFKVEGK